MESQQDQVAGTSMTATGECEHKDIKSSSLMEDDNENSESRSSSGLPIENRPMNGIVQADSITHEESEGHDHIVVSSSSLNTETSLPKAVAENVDSAIDERSNHSSSSLSENAIDSLPVSQNGAESHCVPVNGNKASKSDKMQRTEMDALLEEESERLNKLSLPPIDGAGRDKKQEVMGKEHQYKRLIELLTKSQFYTDFLIKKLTADANKKPQKRGKRKSKESTGEDTNGHPLLDQNSISSALSPNKVHKSGTEQVMAIAADVLSSKQSNEEKVKEEVMEDEETDRGLTRTLDNGLVVPLGQPQLLTGACLRDYQMEGLNWLRLLFENGVNGILADEMGLGKTIQVIALIAHLIEKNVRGPFLIIGPLSTLPNWALEFERFTPQIPFVLYHGSAEKRAEVKKFMSQKQIVEGRKVYPVVITSYDYPLRDQQILGKLNWRYIIVDEGHRLKNHNSLLSRALRKFTSANRLLLTGTPLHNSLSELWALLNFLVPEIFDDLEIFESWFNLEDLAGEDGNEKLLEEEKKKKVLSTMHKILSPFMLRRVKSDVNLNLPPKKELVVYAPMTPIQVDLYRAVLDYNWKKLTNKSEEETTLYEDGKRPKRTCTTTKKTYAINEMFRLDYETETYLDNSEKKALVVQDKENQNYAIRVKMQNTGMMMRKIVNHPYLVQYPLEPGTEYARIDEDIVKTSGKLLVLDAMLTKLKERGHKVLLFSTFTSLMDILEDYLSLRSFKYVRLDGSTSLDDRQIAIKEFNNNPELFLFLISTRAGGLGINLAAADTVILYDSDWNPQVDLQAQDRCHRIGQTRPVIVYRFVTAGTVDERIVVRAAAKRKLEKIIIHKGNYSALNKQEDAAIDLEELQKLLNSRDHQRVIHPNGFVFSDEELDELLDRSDMMEGNASASTSDDSGIKARAFKEYYGYTGTKVVDSNNEELSSNAQIVDEDSNDAPCEVSPVRRSPVKKVNGVSEISSQHVEGQAETDTKKKDSQNPPNKISRKRSTEEAAVSPSSKKNKVDISSMTSNSSNLQETVSSDDSLSTRSSSQRNKRSSRR